MSPACTKHGAASLAGSESPLQHTYCCSIMQFQSKFFATSEQTNWQLLPHRARQRCYWSFLLLFWAKDEIGTFAHPFDIKLRRTCPACLPRSSSAKAGR